MKITVLSLTRDRLEFSKVCFKALQEKAGTAFEHMVLDNGSEDGTQRWLENEYRVQYKNIQLVVYNPTNVGISKALNQLKTVIPQCDYVLKADNDMMPITDGFLAKLVETQQKLEAHTQARWVVSPKVLGLIKQPQRFFGLTLPSGERIGQTDTMGGISRLVPYDIFMQIQFDESLPKAYGTDGQMNQWCMKHGVRMGYAEDLEVEHYLTTEGQRMAMPDYFVRKEQEEQC